MTAIESPFRVYLDPDMIGADGYPYQWANVFAEPGRIGKRGEGGKRFGVKDLVRERDGSRCLRCGHPYAKGMGEWSPCDSWCTHRGPVRCREIMRPGEWVELDLAMRGETAAEARLDDGPESRIERYEIEARWRILTVHHLNGVKADLRWWNLVSLCQRCHLTIQAKVYLERPWRRPHSDWFRPFVAAYYAWSILEIDVPEPFEPGDPRIDEYLALELRESPLF